MEDISGPSRSAAGVVHCPINASHLYRVHTWLGSQHGSTEHASTRVGDPFTLR